MRPKPSPHARRPLQTLIAAMIAILVIVLFWTLEAYAADEPQSQPSYDSEGHLLLPQDYLQWIFIGSSLGLSYSEESGGMEMFHHTLMEPTAYEHFKRTGTFREGTMFVLLLHGLGEGALPQRRGHFANEVHTLEMAVKDSGTFSDGWAYFGFSGLNGVRDRASAFRSRSCYSCHAEHAEYDNVFTQFYPLLAQTAPEGSPFQLARSSTSQNGQQGTEEESRPERPVADVPVAYRGLDPVHLLDGREELGKPEIIIDHEGYRFQFISEPSRAQFIEQPELYLPVNTSCPVVEGASVNPDFFTVHDGKFYIFATATCVDSFLTNPHDYL